jgi:HPt (histidine-containing phosphotransfer) domain-containing protein
MFGSEQSFRKVLQMALDSLTTDIVKIEELLRGGDLKEASRLLHGIKGFAPIFCGETLSAQIADVERSSKTDLIEQVRQVYLDLMPALSQWRGEIGRHLTGLSSVSGVT